MEIEDKDRDPRAVATEEKPKEQPKKNRINHDDPVEEASDESFPASDPPAY